MEQIELEEAAQRRKFIFVTVILLFVLSLYSLLGLTSERKPTIGKSPTVESQRFVPSSPVTPEKVPQFVPPSPVTPELEHAPEKPPAKLPPSYTSFGIQTSQAGLPSPSYGVQPDNLATCSAPAKHAYTLTGRAIIIAAVILLVVMLHKLICYISNVASELAPTISRKINVRASSHATLK